MISANYWLLQVIHLTMIDVFIGNTVSRKLLNRTVTEAGIQQLRKILKNDTKRRKKGNSNVFKDRKWVHFNS
jgi:hypothetical protein